MSPSDFAPSLLSTIALISLLIWVYLVAFRGGFWRSGERLTATATSREHWPAVTAVVPARDEAEVIGETLTALLDQDYAGPFTVILVDDHSSDGTVAAARAAAAASRHPERFSLRQATPLPQGWTGKLWALNEGTRQIAVQRDFVWLCDADIMQPPQALAALVAKAEDEGRDLVSLMVALRCEYLWERLLIPPFIYFFQKLYPFAWVNDPAEQAAAAAGGCILLRRSALERIGGLAAIRAALIDDCALAAEVKHTGHPDSAGIWLGLATDARSIRSYEGLCAIWNMVARTAYTQLRHSPVLLAGTLLGMALTYLAPPLLLFAYPWHGEPATALFAGLAWLMMAFSLIPTLRFYGQPWWFAPLLPLAAGLYSAMTFHSAWRHWRGAGGQWKGRIQARHADQRPD